MDAYHAFHSIVNSIFIELHLEEDVDVLVAELIRAWHTPSSPRTYAIWVDKRYQRWCLVELWSLKR